MKPQTREWIEKAEEDFEVAKRLKRAKKPLYNSVCFHCQQCAEKYIKAFLEEEGQYVPKSHDLVALITLSPSLKELLERKEELEKLTGYAVAFRYPGAKASQKNAEQCFFIASFIRKVIRAKLKLNQVGKKR